MKKSGREEFPKASGFINGSSQVRERISPSRRPSGQLAALFTAFTIALLPAALPSTAKADACVADIWDAGTLNPGFVFPNWVRYHSAQFTAMLWDGFAGTELLQRMTVVNFGSATNADIKAVYWQASCGATTTGLRTLTYAGNYVEDSGTFPAWTWAGTTPDFSTCAELWPLGPGGFTVDIYIDIDPCPASGRTVEMGYPVNSANNPLWWGSISDSQNCLIPWGDVRGPFNMIVHSYKSVDQTAAAPGDTLNYTIYYGRPGTSNLTGVEIIDTMPPYTHYLDGSASPAPESGWDPNTVPPLKLKWTVPGPLPVAGGPSGKVTFKLTMDWGNGESFEPGSGDLGAPEGFRIQNQAQVFFQGVAGCANTVINPPSSTTVRRYLFWKVADNDILFSQAMGQPPDEMIYEIFVKNVSNTKTWWNVHIWDTVPAELDFFGIDCGFEDSCAGWTATPTGCAVAGPGWTIHAPSTVFLTWKLDMPPGSTLSLRWKGKVKSSVVEGSTAINRASIMAYGLTGIVGGTGHSGQQRNFTHQAPIVLPTMYTSYMSWGTMDDFDWMCGTCSDANGNPLANFTYYITFFPLNKKANFSLYEQIHPNDLFAQQGGVTPPINTPVGDCLSGGGNWISGCKAERAPAIYKPSVLGSCPAFTVNHRAWKLVSNSPLIWELLTGGLVDNNDQITYSGNASLTYSGFTAYSYIRICDNASDLRDDLFIVNTSKTVPTTAHLFLWDTATLSWNYQDTGEINTESQWVSIPTEMGPYKIISSDGPILLMKGYQGLNFAAGNNNHGTQAPNSANGYLTLPAAPGDFYAYAGGPSSAEYAALSIGNAGVTNVIFDLYKYIPDNQLLPVTPSLNHLSPSLVDSSGRWVKLANNVTVPAGIAAAGNPYVYGNNGFDGLLTDEYALYKVAVKSGGPSQVYCGRDVYSGFASGHVLHSVINPPSGVEYWFHQAQSYGSNGIESCSNSSPTYGLDFFCPKQGTAVQMVSGDGWSSRYTTNGPDELVCFARFLTNSNLGAPKTRNYKITSTGGIIASAFNVTCQMKQRLYTAPFLSQGVHYVILTPPVVFVGQSFWITVVALESSGVTKTDYTGTTSFTSTDSSAKIQAVGMDGYNYNWVLGDSGVKVFINVVFTSMGLQTIVAQDVLDGSINGLTTFMVVAADVKLEKRKKLTVAASGDTVQFWICWSNYSSATAYSFTITDAVPNGTSYVPELASGAICGQDGPFNASVSMAASSSTSTTPPNTAFVYVAPATSPPATARWLRWTIRDVYVNSTGCVCFKVVVN